MTEPRPIYPKHFFREPVPRQQTGFILMPFKDEFEPVHEAIRTAIESAGLSPLRADDIFSTRSGMEKILRGIAEAEVVVADMTGRNANVFYEAGIAHMIKENVVLLTQDINDIPFDFRHIDHIEYATEGEGIRELTEDLANVIRSLPAEPAVESSLAQQDASEPMTPAAMRRELHRLLQDCERQWVREIVPAQNEVFLTQFWEGIQASRAEAEWKPMLAESMRALHPAFLEPWKPVEELGFNIIEAGEDQALPDILKALERAYNLSKRAQGHPTVLGHGQLLALRTWMLWGAYALERQNWTAVDTLLHRKITLDKPGWPRPWRVSLSSPPKYIYVPDAAGGSQGYGNIDLAILFILQQFESVAGGRFFDVEEARGYFGLWLLASDIAEATHSQDHTVDWPAWAYAPDAELRRLFHLLEDDAGYASGFARAVGTSDTARLNELWESGLRAQLLDGSRMGLAMWTRLNLRELLEHFAE